MARRDRGGVDTGGRDAGHGRRRGISALRPVLLLQEAGGDHRLLPVCIGVAEANVITVEKQQVSLPRPMTHQLIVAT